MNDLHGRNLEISNDSEAKNLLYDLRKQIDDEVDRIEDAFLRLKPLQDAKSTAISRICAKLLWAFLDEQDLKELLARLEPLKLSLSVLQDTFNMSINIAILDELRAGGRPLDDDRRREM
jgi:hypothetical protein